MDRVWNALLLAIDERERLLRERMSHAGSLREASSGLEREIGIMNEKLDRILERIEDGEARLRTSPPLEMKQFFDKIVLDLHALEPQINRLFMDVDNLKESRHPQATDYYRQ